MSDKVIIFDTTLRDGEQCPGASMNLHEKMEVARQLERLNVDVIEAGFPVISEGDFEAVQRIATEVKGPIIAGLARCVTKDIEAAAAAVKPAGERGRIHVFLATSKIHREHKLKKAHEEILRLAADGTRLAKSHCKDVEFSPEDASRTEPEFLAQVVETVIAAGATTVNIPDTVGFAVPEEYAALIRYLKDNVRNIDDAIISVHCHNDLGLAVANSLAAVQAGARQVEGTINGIGERAGNAALEEVVMALKTRADFFGKLHSDVHTREILKTSRIVSRMSGLHVQRSKAIVGENAFAHSSGIHQDGMLKMRETYEIMDPVEVGWGGTELPLTKSPTKASSSCATTDGIPTADRRETGCPKWQQRSEAEWQHARPAAQADGRRTRGRARGRGHRRLRVQAPPDSVQEPTEGRQPVRRTGTERSAVATGENSSRKSGKPIHSCAPTASTK